MSIFKSPNLCFWVGCQAADTAVANIQTQRESCKVKSGLEPLYPPFQIRTKVGASAQNWWLC